MLSSNTRPAWVEAHLANEKRNLFDSDQHPSRISPSSKVVLTLAKAAMVRCDYHRCWGKRGIETVDDLAASHAHVRFLPPKADLGTTSRHVCLGVVSTGRRNTLS
jgi:hypothetical protein